MTAVIGYKAGMTHVVRETGSKNNKREIVDAACKAPCDNCWSCEIY
nr:unnamed protein product [Callosobruchus analis]